MDEEKSLWPARVGLALTLAAATAASLWLLQDAIRQHASELHAGDFMGIARAFGPYLAGIIVAAFALLYVALLRGFGAGRAIAYLLAIIVVVADVDAAVVYATKVAGHEKSFQLAQAATDVESLINRQTAPEESAESLRARAANDARIVAAISQNEAAQINRLRASYQAEMAALIGSGVLSPRALADDVGGIKRAHAHIAQARAAIKKYRDAEQKIFADTRTIVRQAQVDASVRAQLLAAFERSLTQRSSVSVKMWGCEDQILVEADAMVRDLANSQSSWRADGNVFLFSSHHDLNTYRAHLEKIHAIEQNEQMLTAESGDTVVTTVQYGLTN